jgi:hypothetical protein
MHKITLISTIHKKIGKCNTDELCEILEKITPDVIFLEALEDTYSKYQQNTFSSFGVFHQKLEIRAIQKYRKISSFEYVPVLEKEMPKSFDKKFNIVCQNLQYQKMLDYFNSLASLKGFDFLNSKEGMELHNEIRKIGDQILNDKELNEMFYNDIDEYENSMLSNIYEYCMNNKFMNAVFMCGDAHRYNIINKIETYNCKEKLDINWHIYGN